MYHYKIYRKRLGTKTSKRFCVTKNVFEIYKIFRYEKLEIIPTFLRSEIFRCKINFSNQSKCKK